MISQGIYITHIATIEEFEAVIDKMLEGPPLKKENLEWAYAAYLNCMEDPRVILALKAPLSMEEGVRYFIFSVFKVGEELGYEPDSNN